MSVRRVVSNEDTRKYAFASNGKRVEIIGEWAYDSDSVTYQWKWGLLVNAGWYPVASATLPKPIARSVKGAKKKAK